jgi:hypothetical protein
MNVLNSSLSLTQSNGESFRISDYRQKQNLVILLTGDYLSEPQLFSVGYALEQALQGRVEPDLDTVIRSFSE